MKKLSLLMTLILVTSNLHPFRSEVDQHCEDVIRLALKEPKVTKDTMVFEALAKCMETNAHRLLSKCNHENSIAVLQKIIHRLPTELNVSCPLSGLFFKGSPSAYINFLMTSEYLPYEQVQHAIIYLRLHEQSRVQEVQ